jgi:bifunctional non-homologous end joining protein LigD
MNNATTGRFVVQRHEARSLHYDFRLQVGEVFKSWAVPKDPPVSPGDRRLAIVTSDHPVSFGEFEGTIPDGEYGARTIAVWDHGVFRSEQDAVLGLAAGRLEFTLEGGILRGAFELVKLRRGKWRDQPQSRDWLLINRTSTD